MGSLLLYCGLNPLHVGQFQQCRVSVFNVRGPSMASTFALQFVHQIFLISIVYPYLLLGIVFSLCVRYAIVGGACVVIGYFGGAATYNHAGYWLKCESYVVF